MIYVEKNFIKDKNNERYIKLSENEIVKIELDRYLEDIDRSITREELILKIMDIK